MNYRTCGRCGCEILLSNYVTKTETLKNYNAEKEQILITDFICKYCSNQPLQNMPKRTENQLNILIDSLKILIEKIEQLN